MYILAYVISWLRIHNHWGKSKVIQCQWQPCDYFYLYITYVWHPYVYLPVNKKIHLKYPPKIRVYSSLLCIYLVINKQYLRMHKPSPTGGAEKQNILDLHFWTKLWVHSTWYENISLIPGIVFELSAWTDLNTNLHSSPLGARVISYSLRISLLHKLFFNLCVTCSCCLVIKTCCKSVSM